MGTPKIQLGILGGGITSAVGRAHISALRLSNQYDIAAACFSTNEERNLESATAYGLTPEYLATDLFEMLAQRSHTLDAVLILTPTPQHFDQITEVLKSGLSVISEKSLATTSQDAQILLNALQSHQEILVCFNYSAYPMVRELAARISNGSIGDVHTIRVSMPSEYFIRRDPEGHPLRPQHWREKDYEIPTISLDLGVHVVHLAQYLSGKQATRVVARESHSGLIEGVVDSVDAMADYGDDLNVSFHYGKTFLGERNGLKLQAFGTLGSMEWFQQEPDFLTVADRYGNRSHIDPGSPGLMMANAQRYARFKAGHPTGFIEAFANLYEDFAVSLRSHDEPHDLPGTSPRGADAFRGLRELEAIHSSSKQTAWVTIDIGDRDL